MSFTLGSGITIVGVRFSGGSNFTVSIDGMADPAPTGTPPLLDTAPPIYNVTLYDIQSLPLSFHGMSITIVPWQNGASWLSFDYAYVNQTNPSPTPSTSP